MTTRTLEGKHIPLVAVLFTIFSHSALAQYDEYIYLPLDELTILDHSVPYRVVPMGEDYLIAIYDYEQNTDRTITSHAVYDPVDNEITDVRQLKIPGYSEYLMSWLHSHEDGVLAMLSMKEDSTSNYVVATILLDPSLNYTWLDTFSLEDNQNRFSHYGDEQSQEDLVSFIGRSYNINDRPFTKGTTHFFQVNPETGKFETSTLISETFGLIRSCMFSARDSLYYIVSPASDAPNGRQHLYTLDLNFNLELVGRPITPEVRNDTTYLYGISFLDCNLETGEDHMDCLLDVGTGSEYELTRASYDFDDLVEGYDVAPRFGTSPGINQGYTYSTRVADGRRFVASSDFTFIEGSNVSPNTLYLHEYSQEFELLSWWRINTGDEMLVRDVLHDQDRIIITGEKMALEHTGTIHGYLMIFQDRLTSVDDPLEHAQRFSLFPNPVAQDAIELRYIGERNNVGSFDYRILDLLGRQHQSGRITESSGQIDVSQITAGMYLVEVWDEDHKQRAVMKFQRL